MLIIGAGYSDVNTAGKGVLFLDVRDGTAVKIFNETTTTDMVFSIPSQVRAIDSDSNNYRDKVYVGDTGGQLWRIGNFPGTFPEADENIANWAAEVLFETDATKKFFYPPSVTLEIGYDLILSGTGDREDPCDQTTADIVFAVKDTHDSTTTYSTTDLTDVTDPTATPPNLDDPSSTSKGWYIELETGEKVLSEGTVFGKVYFFSTFIPNDDPCLPGGIARLYAVNYKTGGPAIFPNPDGSDNFVRSLDIGGGIPSKPVLVIGDDNPSDDNKVFISVGGTNPDADSESQDAGIISKDTGTETNFFYRWWKEVLD